MDKNEIIDWIYSEIFKYILFNEQDIFICGKASDNNDSIRNRLQIVLKRYGRINIVYPEWIFNNLLQNKKNDLLTLENILANDVDKIILPLEGPGAYCELGSFVMNKEIRKKLIIINEAIYKNKNSYINNGPIRLLKKENNEVIYYEKNKENEIITEIINKIIFSKGIKRNRQIENIFTLSYFLLLVIGVFEPINKKIIEEGIIKWKNTITDEMIDTAIENMIENSLIKIKLNENDEIIELSKEGKERLNNSIIEYIKKKKKYLTIRTTAMWIKRKEQKKKDRNGGINRLLEMQQE